MKKTTVLLGLLFCLKSLLFSQNTFSLSSFDTFQLVKCSFDTSKKIGSVKNWQVYQTLDDKWNGTIDSSRCLGFVKMAGQTQGGIAIADVNTQKPVFVRALLENLKLPLLKKDWLYRTGIFFLNKFRDSITLKNGTNCPDESCSGALLEIEIPDATNLLKTSRAQRINIKNPTSLGLNGCIITEKFDTQRLKEFVLKLTFDKAKSNDTLTFFRPNFQTTDPIQIDTFSKIRVPQFYFKDSVYNYPLKQARGFGPLNFLFKYNLPNQYPDANHYAFVDVSPEVNTDSIQKINLIVNQNESVYFQPFTSLRGGLVNNSTEKRHNVTLINNGGQFCLNIVDLIFQDDDINFYFLKGDVDFGARSTCMMFKNGGTLTVGKDALFNYGEGGIGALALGSGRPVILEQNSSLVINNRLVLLEEAQNDQVFIDLRPTTRLAFGKNAQISINPKAAGGQMRLNVLMNGGVLDDAHLPEAQRLLINRIYPKRQVSLSDNLNLYPNPVKSVLAFDFNSEKEETITLSIFDIKGNAIFTWQQNLLKGVNHIEAPMDDIANGFYLLKLKNTQGVVVKKFVKN